MAGSCRSSRCGPGGVGRGDGRCVIDRVRPAIGSVLPGCDVQARAIAPLLSQRNRDATVYRLIWLPTFHHPVCVRIDRTGEWAKLSARYSTERAGMTRVRSPSTGDIALDAEQLRELDRHLEQAAFWKMRLDEKRDGIVVDGDQLIVEGVKGGKYHIVETSLPTQPTRSYAATCSI